MRKRLILLIHGVGGAEAGELQKAVQEHAPSFGANPIELHEYHWNSLIDHPGKGELGTEYVSSLIRGLTGSALVDNISRPAAIVRTAFLHLLSVVPILIVWGVLLAISWVDHGTPDKWRPLVMPLDLLLIPAAIMFHGLLEHSAHAFFVCAELWGGGVLAVLILYLLISTFRGLDQFYGALRAIVLACLWPPVGIAGYISSVPLYFALPYAGFAVLGFTIAATGSDSHQIVAVDFSKAIYNLPEIILTVLGVTAVAGCIIWIVNRILGPIFKILADIFRYAGDPEYRTSIQHGLDDRVRLLGSLEDTEVYLVGHSLGSVIAVDALMRPDSPFSGARALTLITLGSPLYRCFARFFSCAMPTPDDVAPVLHVRYAGFGWLNVYRPLDPIGTRLFRKPQPSAREYSTRQWRRLLLAAHTNYWSDHVVAQHVRDGLLSLCRGSREKKHSAAGVKLKVFDGTGERRLPPSIGAVLAGVMLFAPVVLLFVDHLFAASHLEIRDYRETVRIVSANSVAATAKVQTREIDRPNGNTGLKNPSFESYITYPTDGESQQCWQKSDTCHEEVIDSDMAQFLRTTSGTFPNIRYLRGHPAKFYVPDYEPQPPGILGLIGSTLWCIVLTCVWLWAALRYFDNALSAWLGELPSPKRRPSVLAGSPGAVAPSSPAG